MKLFICGYARHGKDFAAEFISNRYGLKFDSSSNFAMNAFVREGLALRYGLRYATSSQCYEDRVNHRAKWFEIIKQFNKEDPARLARLMLKDNDIYVGIRNVDELRECRRIGLATLVMWVDASYRLGTIEDRSSNNITPEDCELIVLNNGTQEEFTTKLRRIFDNLLGDKHG